MLFTFWKTEAYESVRQVGGFAGPLKSGQLRFFGQQEKCGQSQFLKRFAGVSVCVLLLLFSKSYIFYLKLKSAW